jgi:hypothetical protein
MAGYYERRISRAAIWCRRLAVLAVPFFILTIILHRSDAINSYQAFMLIAFGIAMLLASLAFGVRAATDLWEKGYKGGRATVNGMVLALLLLTPFGIQLFRALENPQLSDVATDVVNPPQFLQPLDSAGGNGAQPGQGYDNLHAQEVVANYPELVARRYDAPPERVATSVLAILERWDWPIVASVNRPAVEQPPVVENPDGELAGGEEEKPVPVEQDQQGDLVTGQENSAFPDMVVQVRARSLILKLRSELVIRLIAAGNTTLVDVRSASLWGPHDFGRNTRDIADFLKALDDDLLGIAGE